MGGAYKEFMVALLLTLAAFAIMLVLARVKVPLAVAIVIGSAALGAFFRLGAIDILAHAALGVIKPMSIGLLVTITLLLGISEAMRRTGRLEEMVALAKLFLRRPVVTMAVLPALIGLLPMPGGALFSAPMVASAAREEKVGGDLLSAVNYWWRHIWEHWWPLYPGVILAISLTRSDLLTFAGFQAPLGVFMAAAGLLVLRRMHASLRAVGPKPPPGTKRGLLRATGGIWIILIVWGAAAGAARAALGAAPPLPLPKDLPLPYADQAYATARELVPLILGLLAGLLWTVRGGRLPARALRAVLVNRSMLPLIGLVISVMIFQNILEGVKAANKISQGLNKLHVPLAAVVIVLPFVAGMVTGVAFGFVGVSFPIVLELVRSMPDHPAMRPYAVLAYACGHLGMMISPIHLCYVVSNQYFGTTFAPVFRHIAAPTGVMAVLVAAYFAVLRLAMG
jgi:hypothetical protein